MSKRHFAQNLTQMLLKICTQNLKNAKMSSDFKELSLWDKFCSPEDFSTSAIYLEVAILKNEGC